MNEKSSLLTELADLKASHETTLEESHTEWCELKAQEIDALTEKLKAENKAEEQALQQVLAQLQHEVDALRESQKATFSAEEHDEHEEHVDEHRTSPLSSQLEAQQVILDDLHKESEQKDRNILALEKKVREKCGELVAQNHVVQDKDEELESLKQELETVRLRGEEEIEDLRQQWVLQQDMALETLRTEQDMDRMDALQEQAAESAEQLEELQLQLNQQKLTELEELRKQMAADKVEALQALSEELSLEKDRALNELRTELSEGSVKSDVGDELQDALGALRDELDADKQTALGELSQRLHTEHEADLAKLRIDLTAENDRALSNLRDELNQDSDKEKEQVTEEVHEELQKRIHIEIEQTFKADMDTRDTLIEQLKHSIIMSDEKVQDLQNRLRNDSENEDVSRDVEETKAERLNHQAELSEKLQIEHEAELARLREELTEDKDSALAALRDQLLQVEQVEAEVPDEVRAELHKSIRIELQQTFADQLETKDAEIEQLKNNIRQSEETIYELKIQLAEDGDLSAETEALEKQISEMALEKQKIEDNFVKEKAELLAKLNEEHQEELHILQQEIEVLRVGVTQDEHDPGQLELWQEQKEEEIAKICQQKDDVHNRLVVQMEEHFEAERLQEEARHKTETEEQKQVRILLSSAQLFRVNMVL